MANRAAAMAAVATITVTATVAAAAAAAAITASTTTAQVTGGKSLAPGRRTDRSPHGGGLAPFPMALGSMSMLLEKVADVGEGSFYRPPLLHARSHPLAQVGGRSRLRRVARIAEHDRAEVVSVSYTPGNAESNAIHTYTIY